VRPSRTTREEAIRIAPVPARTAVDLPRDDESWQRFRLIADTATDVVYQASPDGLIQWVSTTVESLLGYRPDELIGVAASSLTHPDDLAEVMRLRATVYEGASVDEIPCRFRMSAGTYRECAVRARPLVDAGGSIVGSIVALRDTHDRAAALRALTTLSRGNAVLVRADDEDTLLQQMCETVVEAGQYLFAWYGRPADDEEKTVRAVARAGLDGDYLPGIQISWGDGPLGQGPTGRALRTGCTQIVDDFTVDSYAPWADAARASGFRCSISLPVLVEEHIDGALMVYAAESGAFDAFAESLLEDLAADLGYGLARLRDSMRLAEALSSSVFVLAAAVESRDPWTAGHQAQVGELCRAIGRELGLDDDRLHGLALGASIHDLGKISISHETLTTPGALSPEQWDALRQHPRTGHQIAGRFPWPWPIAAMILQHHERLDGSGYPAGLVGDEILLEARVIAVADTFEAMAHDRPYRPAPGVDRAVDVIVTGRGTLYDVDVVDAFLRVLSDGFTFDLALA
jgi:PAS domain S-box-containing protein